MNDERSRRLSEDVDNKNQETVAAHIGKFKRLSIKPATVGSASYEPRLRNDDEDAALAAD